jgi:hypothetical protein
MKKISKLSLLPLVFLMLGSIIGSGFSDLPANMAKRAGSVGILLAWFIYNPAVMPRALTKAHNELDRAVDLAYRPQPFISEANRMEFLFGLYEKFTADLFTKVKVRKTKKCKE